MMEKLKTENSDHNSWCSMKHAMATYWFMLEVHYANPEDLQFKYLAQQAYEHMVTILSIFLWVPEIVTCWRCLCDQLIEKDAG